METLFNSSDKCQGGVLYGNIYFNYALFIFVALNNFNTTLKKNNTKYMRS